MTWCLVRLLSIDPGSEEVVHADSIRIDKNFRINITIHVVNECKMLKRVIRIEGIYFCVDALHPNGRVKVTPADWSRVYTDIGSLILTIKRVLGHTRRDITSNCKPARDFLKEYSVERFL
jgi:hypothetical protein